MTRVTTLLLILHCGTTYSLTTSYTSSSQNNIVTKPATDSQEERHNRTSNATIPYSAPLEPKLTDEDPTTGTSWTTGMSRGITVTGTTVTGTTGTGTTVTGTTGTGTTPVTPVTCKSDEVPCKQDICSAKVRHCEGQLCETFQKDEIKFSCSECTCFYREWFYGMGRKKRIRKCKIQNECCNKQCND